MLARAQTIGCDRADALLAKAIRRLVGEDVLRSIFLIKRSSCVELPDVQLLAHASKLRHRHFPVRKLFFGELADVYVFPIRVPRQRRAVLFDPRSTRAAAQMVSPSPRYASPSRSRHPPCSGGKPSLHGSDANHENCRLLHQFAKVRAALVPLAMLPPYACFDPQPLDQHPPP
jgi:hypothetical protein